MAENRSRKILFTDFDGVLHPLAVADAAMNAGDEMVLDGLFIYAPILLEILANFPHVDLVCHSSWRSIWQEPDLRAMLPSDLDRRLVGITDSHGGRHESIVRYAARLGLADGDYLIVDDDQAAFPPGLPNLIIVPEDTGISTASVRQAIIDGLGRLGRA